MDIQGVGHCSFSAVLVFSSYFSPPRLLPGQSVMAWLMFLLYVICFIAGTEGDPAYDYSDAYDEEFDGESALGVEPQFDVPLVNVTVVEGQTAMLPCSIKHLAKKYKVSWTDKDITPLTYEDRRVIDDSRFSIVRSFPTSWDLQIRDVQWSHQGSYQCTINTDPIRFKTVMLHVKVPPKILDGLSSDDVTVTEGDTVVLVCNVTGVPTPSVTWYRKPVGMNGGTGERKHCVDRAPGPGIGHTGEMIIISNVTRYCDDNYECVASNGVSLDVKRKIKVTVHFPPEVMVRTPQISQKKGRTTILECQITGNPQSLNFWKKDGHRLRSAGRHTIEVFTEQESNTITLSLQIESLTEEDFGDYTCTAMNPLGTDEGKITLTEIKEVKDRNDRDEKKITVLYINRDKTKTTPHTSKTMHSPPSQPPVMQPNNEVMVNPNPLVSGGSSKCTQQFTLLFTLLCLVYVHFV